MCGIFGFVGEVAGREAAARSALATLRHRGPDQWGEWHDDRVYLGHQRLSILDLSDKARQPMSDADENVFIAVNGEIYGFLRLREELKRKHEFRSRSDSEIIVHGYKEWGLRNLLERIDGMYAFCLYDRPKQKVYLVRDRAGIKPLYYAKIDGVVAWASELKALREFFGPARLRPDYTALYDFLTYLYVPAPKALYCDVYKLEPGHYIEIDVPTAAIAKNTYWTLSVAAVSISPVEAETRLQDLVDSSVRDQMVSDVPVGIFLSGGMDSSVVAASAVRCSDRVRTFTIRVDDPSLDESGYARAVAEHLGTEHFTRDCAAVDALEWEARIQEWYDEPFADMSAIPTHLVSRLSRDRITVALSGDGGDEIFGGYQWYWWMKERQDAGRGRWRRFRPLTARLKQRLGVSLWGRVIRRLEFDHTLDEMETYVRLLGGLLKDDKMAYAKAWEIPEDYDDYWYFRRFWRPDLPLLTRLQYLDFHTYLPDDILTKVDRASMQVALEVRVPLLSRDLIEFAFCLPESVRYAGNRLKGLFKDAFRERLPAVTLTRRKQGFSIPLKAWNLGERPDRPSTPERILARHYASFLPDGLASSLRSRLQ